jgi:lipopolysaccharide/colanic/teichoic acid biosynthesis glycosyltransferase
VRSHHVNDIGSSDGCEEGVRRLGAVPTQRPDIGPVEVATGLIEEVHMSNHAATKRMPSPASRAPEQPSALEIRPARQAVPAQAALGVIPVGGRESVYWEYRGPHIVSAFLWAIQERVFYELVKRTLDVVSAFILLLATAPLFALVAALVKCTSTGPVFYRHRRLGKDGREFWCVKFRTMVADADEQLRRNAELREQFDLNFKLECDPRITRVGAFLRKTSIDELPQLLLVLRGDMSMIGPRPIVADELERYGAFKSKLLSVRPGLSGFWQACGRSTTSYTERVQMDMFYVDNRCVSMDLLLYLLTAVAVIRRSGAC